MGIASIDYHASGKNTEIGIEEKTGSYLPADLEFTTSSGKKVTLGDIIDAPTLLALVYYECPGICSPLLNELAWVGSQVKLVPGKDFKIISISFDHEETSEISARWKKNYLQSVNGKIPDDAWIFLTGDSLNIKKVTDAAGFYFKPDRDEFIHAASLIAVSPDRKITRYLFGTSFNPFDVKMSLLEAESGKTNPAITKVLQFCFSYDPEGRNYTLNVTRIAGVLMLTGVLAFMIFLLKKKKQ